MYIILGVIWLNIASFIMDIPSIGYYDFIYKYNTLDKGVIYNKYDDGPIIIMGHSGTGDAAVFNNILNLAIDSKINLYYPNKVENYIIKEKRMVDKDSKVTIQNDKNNLYLVTCDLNYLDKQWIILAKKV